MTTWQDCTAQNPGMQSKGWGDARRYRCTECRKVSTVLHRPVNHEEECMYALPTAAVRGVLPVSKPAAKVDPEAKARIIWALSRLPPQTSCNTKSNEK